MRRIFLRHGDYSGSRFVAAVLNETGRRQIGRVREVLGRFVTEPTTAMVSSDCDRAIESTLLLTLGDEEGWRAIEALREAASAARHVGERRYVALEPERLVELGVTFELCGNCIEHLPQRWLGYQGDLIFVGHLPAAEKLPKPLKLSEGQYGEF